MGKKSIILKEIKNIEDSIKKHTNKEEFLYELYLCTKLDAMRNEFDARYEELKKNPENDELEDYIEWLDNTLAENIEAINDDFYDWYFGLKQLVCDYNEIVEEQKSFEDILNKIVLHFSTEIEKQQEPLTPTTVIKMKKLEKQIKDELEKNISKIPEELVSVRELLLEDTQKMEYLSERQSELETELEYLKIRMLKLSHQMKNKEPYIYLNRLLDEYNKLSPTHKSTLDF